MAIVLEHSFEGPFKSGCFDVTYASGRKFRVSGRAASLISLILAGYRIRDDFRAMDPFTLESLAEGQANAKAVANASEDSVG